LKTAQAADQAGRPPTDVNDNVRTPPVAILMIAYTNYETDPRVIRAAEAAAEAGFAVDVLTLRRQGQPAEEVRQGVRVLRVSQERYRGQSHAGYVLAYAAFFWRCFAASTRLFLSRRYRIIHVHNMPDALVFSVMIPRLLGAKVILDIHDPMPETFGSKFPGTKGSVAYKGLLLLERLSVAFATRTVTVNEPVKEKVLLKHGYRPQDIGVVANFADDRLFKPMPSPVIDGRVRFVFHGTILERYGLRTLVEAASLAKNKDKIQVRIIGEGDFSATLKRLIDDHGVKDVIQFDNRVYPLIEIPQVLADCHVGLAPLDVTPISDVALPLKLIEYTCLGLPTVTVTSTAVSYYFRSDECMFYPPGDARALARILDEVAEDPGRLDGYRQRLAAARERLSWSREKQKYVDMLQRLAGGPASLRDASATGSSIR
jgi:glycosyltransferase involved in cell wall biosynthesis